MLSELSYWKLLTRRKPAATIANDAGLTLAARATIMTSPPPPPTQFPKSSNYKKPPVVNMNRIDIGSTLGIGVFIIIGFLTRDIAGPSVIISFMVATAVALLAGKINFLVFLYTYFCCGRCFSHSPRWCVYLARKGKIV